MVGLPLGQRVLPNAFFAAKFSAEAQHDLRAISAPSPRHGKLRSAKNGLALGVKGLDAFAKIVRLPQAAVAMAFELDCGLQIGVFGRVEERFRCALRQWRE